MDRSNQDISDESCVRNDSDNVKEWVEHYARLLNGEFDWPSETLLKTTPVAGKSPEVSRETICMALSKMKCGKATGPSGSVAEILKATGVVDVEMMKQQIS